MKQYGYTFSEQTKVLIASTNEDEVRQILEALRPVDDLPDDVLETLKHQLTMGLALLAYGSEDPNLAIDWLEKELKGYKEEAWQDNH